MSQFDSSYYSFFCNLTYIRMYFSVDGLVKCNTQIVGRSAENNRNASHTGDFKSSNASEGSPHASSNFLFVEGNPFTATLWAGDEGFHMTVNGRHETSFAYREVSFLAYLG